MKRLAFFFIGILFVILTSCGTQKKVPQSAPLSENLEKIVSPDDTSEEIKETTPEEVAPAIEEAISRIPDYAMEFLGTRYKYGGTTSEGMDCSGLVITAFLKEDIQLPRTSRDISLQGERINLDEVSKGDLLFFQTNSRRKVINHVGIVVEKKEGEIRFIHSTNSRGVIISSLKENYWQKNFVMARRMQ